MKERQWKSVAAYAGLLCAACAVGVCASWFIGDGIDNYAYDFLFRNCPPKPWPHQSVVLAIDEAMLRATPDGMHGIRKPLTRALELLAAGHPKTVAIDLTLADRSADPKTDDDLAAAMSGTPNLVLASELVDNGWEHPLPKFRAAAAEVGHVYTAAPDDVTRAIPLEEHYGHEQRWALALQTFRLFEGGAPIVQTPRDVRIGSAAIPAPETSAGRLMRVRFTLPEERPPAVSMEALLQNPSLAASFRDKAVFIGVTAITEVRDRLMTPIGGGRHTSGVQIHDDAFETMRSGQFLTDAGVLWVVLFSIALAVGAGLSFRYLPGWIAYAGGVAVIAAAAFAPYVFFIHGRVFSFATPAAVAWLSVGTAAAYYHLVVRRNWRIEQAARERYQQAMHFVTHEMRTPLSAIQGSSELISRYPLTEEKRKQVAQLINSESKRLARMVEVFLSVERLSAGQMELKREAIAVNEMIEICVNRVRPLAERKRIAIHFTPDPAPLGIAGDRELMEYACYNLLTNAVKYSPQQTEVTVSAWRNEGGVRIAVKDQGIGMDQKEVRQIFQKFYRTAKAEASGEVGTGIGLSIVQQIVEQHGGRIDVTSQPGVGSCFTLSVPAAAPAAAPTVAERL
jgi:signal transduction histidine kinase